MFESAEAVDLIFAMDFAARAESRAVAERLGAVARLFERRRRDYAEAEMWRADLVVVVGAEVSAAQNISRGRAEHQVRMAVTLHTRLPRVAAAFRRGDIDLRMVQTVLSRTENVEDNVVGSLDEAIAPELTSWMRLSKNALRDRVDSWVADFDPAGVRLPPVVKDNLYIDIEADAPGAATVTGVLDSIDAMALHQRLDALAATVCPKDPRSHRNLRAAAAGALGRGETSIQCQCGTAECPASATRESAAQVVIHIVAEQGTADETSDKPGYLAGLGVLTAEQVRREAATAQFVPVTFPDAAPEAGYQPSRRLRDFLQWRDLTCRWPGCDAPVRRCDVDHTTPWPFGATHPSGTKHYCRTHHLIKTFLTGPNGWHDRQRPDGTIVLTAPTGHVYETEPLGGVLFPGLRTPTTPLPDVEVAGQDRDKSAMMPRRRTTREQDRRARIARERRLRAEMDAAEESRRQAWLAETYEPPPF